ncbi:fimbrillin family protein [Parasphaerochaeta coccoides]|uniref:Regulator of chromosome condensation RCC1 n=1 Tax=Parasphaerochaeta coccoides (strain ATCC BAA-1237 / DSM 17374 / SPN1) TaxID=760011 RepID=F4GHB4_PARC1|nr:fimbrillin family protein [Parasphaerochaeta coccoides]AEC02013.1 regulator of chromosome condensation RCC1 [Parasphaerochaeta coccoides DSM 17374]
MRKNSIVLVSILMVLFVFASCNGNLCVSHDNDVHFSTEIGRKATANSEWQADDEVSIYMVAHDALAASATTERTNQAYTADTASETSAFSPADNANTLKWDDISTNPAPFFDFISYYPYVSSIANTTALPIHVYPGSGEQDTGKADFLWGRTDNVQNNTSTVHLKLEHMLSRLIVNISPSTTVDATAINDATGGFTATVRGLNTQTSINLNDGTLDAASVIESIVMKDISDTLTQSERNEGKRRFEAVLIPVGNTFALTNVSLEFVLTGGAGAGTYTWKPSTTGAVADGDKHLIHFDKGKQHVYNMTLNTEADEVAVAAIQIEIKDWDDGDGINGAAEKAYSLTFGDNGATRGSAPERMYAHEGNQITLPDPGSLEKDIHYFYGWNTLPDGNGSYYAAGESFTMPANDVMLYAQWLVKVKSVSAGDEYTMILKKDGTLWATGDNWAGQLGLGAGSTYTTSTPVQVKGSGGDGFMTDVEAVFTGAYHTMLLKNDRTLWAIGFNRYGQLGDGTSGDLNNKKTPVQVTSMNIDPGSPVVTVSAGNFYTMIVKKDGTLWATGRNEYGQLGDGTIIDKAIPVQIKDDTDGSVKMTDVAAVSAGKLHTMIVKKDGTLWATGLNDSGQLGDDTTENRNISVQVKGFGGVGFMTDVAAVFSGENYTMILKKDGTLWATGQNSTGQLGNGDTHVRKTPVQIIL